MRRGPLHCRPDGPGIFITEKPVLAGVRIQAADGDISILDPEAFESLASQHNRTQNPVRI